jgi:hypothetical protein
MLYRDDESMGEENKNCRLLLACFDTFAANPN